MAKTKTKHAKSAHTTSTKTPEQLYASTVESIDQLDFPSALIHATELLSLVDPALANGKSSTPTPLATPALKLLGEVHIELGDEDAARRSFALCLASPSHTSALSPSDEAQVHFWLAQLSEEGGFDSVKHFERGIGLLKDWLKASENTTPSDEHESLLWDAGRHQVASALCSVAEIYMTDLSWEDDAEDRCERLVTEALLFAPDDPAVLQTLASVRLSQVKVDEARSALERSMGVWRDLDPDDDAVPDFATRISLARLCMEAEMESEAMVVLERLALEDDTSVEACYLGGWCLYLMAEKGRPTNGNDTVGDEDVETLKQSSWKWLQNTLRLYDSQQYEDVNLKAHVEELLEAMKKEPGFTPVGTAAVDETEEWVDEEGGDSEDEEMEDS